MGSHRFVITDHAIDRYIERHAPELSPTHARRTLETLLEDATPIRARSIKGDLLWRTDGTDGDPPVHFVVKPDGGEMVIATVLPIGCEAMGDEAEDEIEAEMIAAYRRIAHLVEHDAPKVELQTEKHLRAEKIQEKLRNQVADLKRIRDALKADVAARLSGAPSAPPQPPAAAPSKRLARQIAHGERMSRERDEARCMLALLMRAAMVHRDAPEIAEALARIERADSGLLDQQFWDRDVRIGAIERDEGEAA